jgi:hypothetical protein
MRLAQPHKNATFQQDFLQNSVLPRKISYLWKRLGGFDLPRSPPGAQRGRRRRGAPQIRPLLALALCGKSARPEPRQTTTAGRKTAPSRAREEYSMTMRVLLLAVAAAASIALGGCSGGREPGDAVGAKVLRNLLSKQGVGAKLIAFKKVDGRDVKTPTAEAYELWYEAEVQFPEEYEAHCADEKQRGRCAYLGLAQDQSFRKGEVLKSEGTLHFVRSDKGWVGEDQNAY